MAGADSRSFFPCPPSVLVGLILIQQILLMGKLSLSIDDTSGNRSAIDSSQDVSLATPPEAAAKTSTTTSSTTFTATNTNTGTPPRYRGNAKSDALLFLFCPGGNTTVRFVEQSVLSSRAAGFTKEHIVVIDTSPSTHCYNDSEFLRAEVGYVYPTVPSELTFAMMQNVAWNLAQRWGFPHYFWQHADVVITHEGENEVFATKAMRIVHAAPSDWGQVQFGYDLFAAYKTEAVAKVRWDQGISHYLADCDFHIRIQFAGYRILSSYAGIVLHIKTLLPSPLPEIKSYSLDWYKERGAFETRPIKKNRLKHTTNPNPGINRKAKVKLDFRGVKDVSLNATQARYDFEHEAAEKYYMSKWGSLNCDWNPGKIEFIPEEFPRFDINDAAGERKIPPPIQQRQRRIQEAQTSIQTGRVSNVLVKSTTAM